MKKCLNCATEFKSWLWIDNKFRNLSSRKYCLTCSPFGKHNTTNIRPIDNKYNCQSCSKIYIYNHQKGHTKVECNSCNANRNRRSKKIWALKYLGGKCYLCGYDKCVGALHFHHREPGEKAYAIAEMMNKSLKSLQAELDKCDLLCANCHAEIHNA